MANRVVLLGRLGADPELRYTTTGQAVANLRVATKEFSSNRDGQREERTEWHQVVVWGTQAENCSKYLTKGRQVYIEGRLQTRNWDDQNGVKHYRTEVVANTVEFIGSANDAPRAPIQPSASQSSKSATFPDHAMGDLEPGDFSPPDDDIPF